MIFNPNEIQQLFNIVDYRLARVVADILGKEFLTDEDKRILDDFNFKWEIELKKIPPYYQSYIFGRLAGVLNQEQLRSLNYTDVEKYIERGQYTKLTSREKATYRAAGTRTYSYIKGMGNRVKETLSNSISEEELKYTVAIKENIEQGVLERKSVQNIVSSLGNQLSDWNKDWGRIVETEMQNVYQLGVAQTIVDKHGADALVYKDVFPGACTHCRQLYTTAGSGSKPRIFKLSSLIANGDNTGRKARDWKPVIGATHPFCFQSPYIEITTIEGQKYIKDIKVGDFVLTHLNRYKKVTKLFKRKFPDNFNHGIFDIYYMIKEGEGYQEEGLHRITGNHKIFANGEKKQVKEIKVGDILQSRKGVNVRVCFILEIPKENYGEYLYNFEVEDDHSYYAENIAVSNCRCPLRYLPEGYEWDKETHSFEPPKSYIPKVERKSKVKITVGDRVFEV